MPRTLGGRITLPEIPGAHKVGGETPGLDTKYGQALHASLQAWAAQIADRIEQAVEFGTFANRPDATGSGMLFYATDTKDFYIDTGSTWTKLYRGYHIDGGRSDSVYTAAQNVDGGDST
jgi:hypothetical protein